MLCAISRIAGRIISGEDRMLCAIAHDRGWRIVPMLDALCYWREGASWHCARMAEDDGAA